MQCSRLRFWMPPGKKHLHFGYYLLLVVLRIRRALLLQRISNTSTQTDPVKTVLMRDAHLDAQPDLCRKRDASVETDGAVTLRNDGLQGCT